MPPDTVVTVTPEQQLRRRLAKFDAETWQRGSWLNLSNREVAPLVERGWLEGRKVLYPAGVTGPAAWEYRLTPAGRLELEDGCQSLEKSQS